MLNFLLFENNLSFISDSHRVFLLSLVFFCFTVEIYYYNYSVSRCRLFKFIFLSSLCVCVCGGGVCFLYLNAGAFQHFWKMFRYHVFECCFFSIFDSILYSKCDNCNNQCVHRSRLTVVSPGFLLMVLPRSICVRVCVFCFCFFFSLLYFWLGNQFIFGIFFSFFFLLRPGLN